MTRALSNRRALLGDGFPLPLDRPFSVTEATGVGLHRDVLRRLVSQGLLRRVVKGVYVASQVPDSTAVRGRALSLVLPAGSVVTDWTACWYWTGVDRPNSHLTVPHLSVFRVRGQRALRGELVASGQRWLLRDDLTELHGGLHITTPIRTAWDLGRFAPRIVAIGGMDALARHGSFSVLELVGGVERFKRQRGVRQLRGLAPLVDPRSESVGESSLRLSWLDIADLPAPEPQVSIVSNGVEAYRIDLGVEELRFGAEYDGEQWHGLDRRRADMARRHDLDQRFGWSIEVFRREHVYGERADVATRLPRAIAEARRRLGRTARITG